MRNVITKHNTEDRDFVSRVPEYRRKRCLSIQQPDRVDIGSGLSVGPRLSDSLTIESTFKHCRGGGSRLLSLLVEMLNICQYALIILGIMGGHSNSRGIRQSHQARHCSS
jgi:hypothetical protein